MNSFRLVSLAASAGLLFVSLAPAQNVSIISGNGQVLGGTNFILQPLVVQVTDANGNPQSGVSVNWQGGGFNGFFLETQSQQLTSVSDTNGMATAHFSLPATVNTLNVTVPLVQTPVTATAGANTAMFTMTQLASAPLISVTPFVFSGPNNASNLQALNSPITGKIGAAGPSIQLQFGASNGQSTVVLPNAAVQILNFQDPAKAPLASCAGSTSAGTGINTVLTDANGNATCNLVFSGQPGTGEFVIAVGGIETGINTPSGFWQPLLDPTDPSSLPNAESAFFVNLIPLKINIAAGAPGSIKIVAPAGGTQSITAGGAVSLTVETDNTAGLPLSGSTVNWKVVSPTSGVNLSSASTSTDTTGRTTNTVTVPSTFSGTVTVTATLASDSTKFVTFTINVSPPVTISQFQYVSGANQTAIVNTAFAQPLVVKISTSAGSAVGISVQFAVLSGSAALSASSVNTDSNGLAQVTVTAGPVAGPVSIVATTTTATNTVSFALTVSQAAPTIVAGNFVNGADLQPNSLSPCGLGALVTAPGTLNVAPVTSPFPGAPVPSSPIQLGFAGIVAPVISIGMNAFGQQQVVFQVPCEVTPGSSIPVTVSIGGAVSNVSVNVQAASPGIFQTKMSDGVFRALLVRPDGSYVSLANPARLGEIEIAFVTGLGPTTPQVSTQSLPAPSSIEATAPDAKVLGQVVPGMSGNGASLVYARLSEDLPGVYVVAFQVPSSVPTGNDIPFSVSVIPPGSTAPISSGASKVPVHQ
ncbi:MAG TPA: hypothetical protein VMH81_05790 [Bryobacteraceae bacterium]|nr:hypothetical protein [Bryobacteraceae bacterium]